MDLNAANVATHYYKLGHVSAVSYHLYQLASANDQGLLELELHIRFKHPAILITYYNKYLYYFHFDHNHESLDLTAEYPELSLKSVNSISVETLVGPAQKSDKDDDAHENIPYINLGLLKAVKKLVLFNLSRRRLVSIFGNYCVHGEDANHIVYIDPVLLANGDLLLCVFRKPGLRLFSSSVVAVDNPDLNSNFVIYIVPSGIRCHLFDSLKPLNSFTYTPPKNQDSLLNLLNLSTGIDLSGEPNLMWVKLIPNLQHLNNQASKIARFIHTVDNKKYILWPWKLCLLQFGKTDDPTVNSFRPAVDSSDPLSLISDFIDFNISVKQQVGPAHPMGPPNPAFSVPSVLSNGIESHEKPDLDVNDMSMMPDLFSGMPDSVNDLFDDGMKIMPDEAAELKVEDMSMPGDLANSSPPVQNVDLANDAGIDDLFGDDGDSDSEIKDEEPLEVIPPDEVEGPHAPANFEDDTLFKLDEVPMDQSNIFAKEQPTSTILDIPKDQMTIASAKGTPYDDPGAPLPMMQTPMIPHTAFDKSRLHTAGGGTDSEENSRSVFSPIVFNPLIRNSIDKKYGKGGKFYVEKESSEPESDRKNLRATSVSGLEIRKPEEIKKGLGIDYKEVEGSTISSGEQAIEDDDEDDDDDEEMAEDDADDEEEESDEDDDNNENSFFKGESPLRLNTQNESFTFSNPQPTVAPQEPAFTAKSQSMAPIFSVGTVNNTGPFSSPLSSNLMMQSTKFNPLPKFDSPFAPQDSPPVEGDKNKYNSPLTMDQDEFKKPSSAAATNASTMTSESRSSSISESSNCLPLILRGINITTIPDDYLLNNIPGAVKMLASASDFNMDMDEDDKDFGISKKNEMIIKLDNLDDFLNWLGPNLIFDLGLNNFKKNLKVDLPNSKLSLEPDSQDSCMVSPSFEESFLEAFPLSYRVKLDEFLSDLVDKEETNKVVEDLDNQLSFLDDITNDEILNPKSKLKKLNEIEWDSIYLSNERNRQGFNEYIQVLQDIKESSLLDPNKSLNPLSESKVRVLKNKKDVLNLNSISTRFWKYLNFDPIYGEKNFQILLISEYGIQSHNPFNDEFLNSLIYNYNECNFGNISKVNLQSNDSRQDLESVSNGLLLVERIEEGFSHVYKQINKKLNGLVELIKLDLINKTNKFEFDRPLLLFFVNFNKNVNSLMEISKVCRNFKSNLRRHQIPIVEVFSKIIPSDALLKQDDNNRYLKYLSSYKLTKLSMNLYNQCPSAKFNATDKQTNLKLFTNLVREPPSKINFKFFNTSSVNKEAFSNDDAFLHLAYERSIDKNWVSAAWSDPLGIINYTKSWCSSTSLLKSGSNVSNNQNNNAARDRNVYYLNTICDQIFEISNELFKKLNEEIIKRTSGLGGKKFLVLTRVNSVIPDDELIHWKRLSLKYKDVSLIVLSVNSSAKVLFKDEVVAKQREEPKPMDQSNDFFKQFNDLSNSGNPSPNNLITSPANNMFFGSASFLSPDPGAATSPSFKATRDMVLSDPDDVITSMIPQAALPSVNSTRVGMKLGILAKRLHHDYSVYEINLLSCSNHWNTTALMKIILQNYRKLITLNDVLGITPMDGHIGPHASDGLVPWHVNAVSKALEYLVHIDVEE